MMAELIKQGRRRVGANLELSIDQKASSGLMFGLQVFFWNATQAGSHFRG
jgi:hypothetical protein